MKKTFYRLKMRYSLTLGQVNTQVNGMLYGLAVCVAMCLMSCLFFSTNAVATDKVVERRQGASGRRRPTGPPRGRHRTATTSFSEELARRAKLHRVARRCRNRSARHPDDLRRNDAPDEHAAGIWAGERVVIEGSNLVGGGGGIATLFRSTLLLDGVLKGNSLLTDFLEIDDGGRLVLEDYAIAQVFNQMTIDATSTVEGTGIDFVQQLKQDFR